MKPEFFVTQSLYFIIPLLVVAIAGLFAEKSGTINIALEGTMIIGAFTGILFINRMQKIGFLDNHQQLLLILSLLVAALSGMIFSALLGFLAIKMKADQVIGGTALNILAAALVMFLSKVILSDTRVSFANNFQFRSKFLSGIPFINYVFFERSYLLTYLGILIFIVSVIIFKYTRFGLRLSSCGEHPEAAQSAGINVIKYRWIGILISGAIAGLGGVIYVIPSQASFSGNVSGYGFLALAVLIFGQWKPSRVLLASLFFGTSMFLSVVLPGTDIIKDFVQIYPKVPIGMILRILPYFATLLALSFTSKKSRAPKSAGIPFDPLSK